MGVLREGWLFIQVEDATAEWILYFFLLVQIEVHHRSIVGSLLHLFLLHVLGESKWFLIQVEHAMTERILAVFLIF